MGTLKNGDLRGQVGNLVSRKYGDQHIVQTKAGRRIRQTEKTKLAAVDFGTASSLAAAIRQAFALTYQEGKDLHMNSRLVQQLQRVLKTDQQSPTGQRSILRSTIKRLENFQFNINSELQDYLYIDPILKMTADKQLSLHLPALTEDKKRWFHQVKIAEQIVIRVQVAGFELPINRLHYNTYQEIEIMLYEKEESQVPTSLSFDCSLPTEINLWIVSLSLLYLSNVGSRSYLHNNKAMHPAAIIGAYIL